MPYISTRGGIAPISFFDAVMMGLATDGGLLLPESFPNVSDKLEAWKNLSYPDLAFEIIRLYTDGDISDSALKELITRSYSTFRHEEVCPVVQLGEVWIQELFHGPTLAFKDVALQFLGNLFEHILKERGGCLNILGATSGDTGSAAIHGVRGKDNINIFILHPHGRISRQQEKQMTTVLDANVFNVAIKGSFDDGQRIVKDLFGDLDFKAKYQLGAVNSVNWARVLAQIVYYFYGAFQIQKATGAKQVQVAVPTGNFGDIFAGYVAVQMGAPVSRLILATNENDILARFFKTGVYSLGEVAKTLSPSMDIQVASNFERYLFYLLGEDGEKLANLMQTFKASSKLAAGEVGPEGVDPLIAAGVGDTAATLKTIGEAWQKHQYVLDPHTAVGVHVAKQHLIAGEPMICLSTAHPAKFGDAVMNATDGHHPRHPILDALAEKEQRLTVLPATDEAIKAHIEQHLA